MKELIGCGLVALTVVVSALIIYVRSVYIRVMPGQIVLRESESNSVVQLRKHLFVDLDRPFTFDPSHLNSDVLERFELMGWQNVRTAYPCSTDPKTIHVRGANITYKLLLSTAYSEAMSNRNFDPTAFIFALDARRVA